MKRLIPAILYALLCLPMMAGAASTPISQAPDAGTLTGAEKIPIGRVGGTPAVIVRGSTSSGAFYRLSALATYYQIHKCTSAGTCTQLGSNYTAHAPTVGDVIKLSVTGTSTVTLTPTIAGTDYSAVTDSDSPITSGSPGIYQGSSNGNIDNWSGGEL